MRENTIGNSDTRTITHQVLPSPTASAFQTTPGTAAPDSEAHRHIAHTLARGANHTLVELPATLAAAAFRATPAGVASLASPIATARPAPHPVGVVEPTADHPAAVAAAGH